MVRLLPTIRRFIWSLIICYASQVQALWAMLAANNGLLAGIFGSCSVVFAGGSIYVLLFELVVMVVLLGDFL